MLKHAFSDLNEELIIATALETEEGKEAIAAHSFAPYPFSLISRLLLGVDELPQGAMVRYKKEAELVRESIDTEILYGMNKEDENERSN